MWGHDEIVLQKKNDGWKTELLHEPAFFHRVIFKDIFIYLFIYFPLEEQKLVLCLIGRDCSILSCNLKS